MAVDLEAIARRGRCDASSLKLALPLIEQGYEAPFLARYRRDELGGLDEATLWDLRAAVDAEQAIVDFRDQLHARWEESPLKDPAIGEAIRKSGSNRTLGRLGKRLRQENAAGVDTDSNRLAVRMLNPQPGDSSDPAEVAASIDSISDAAAAASGLAKALPARLSGDPRVISAAVRWLSRNAKIHISNVHDPHISGEKETQEDVTTSEETEAASETNEPQQASQSSAQPAEAQPAEAVSQSVAPIAEPPAEQPSQPPPETLPENTSQSPPATTAEEAGTTEQDAETNTSPSETAEAGPQAPIDSTTSGSDQAVSSDQAAASDLAASPPADIPSFKDDTAAKSTSKKKKSKPAPAKQKKISPRQRRRRWLVSVLKPLEGKRMTASKLSAFQVVMLGRALRSQVAVCAFEYDAAKLVAEIRRTVISLNKGFEPMLGDLVMQHEADIREAAEAAWWDELHERASTRLVSVTADHLRKHVNRGPVEAKDRHVDRRGRPENRRNRDCFCRWTRAAR